MLTGHDQPVAVFPFDVETRASFSRLDDPGQVFDICQRPRPDETSYDINRVWPRTEADGAEAPAHVSATNETDLRVEVISHQEVFDLETVAVASVIELTAIT